jgi:hypothetical protein
VTFTNTAANFADRNVGPGKTVTVSGIGMGGADAGDYALNSTSATTSANITPATLTYNASPATITAGQTPSGLSGTVSGFVAADSQANDTSGTLLWTTPAGASSHAGQYAIDGGGLTATNYMFVEAPGNVAALTLQPAAAPVPPSVPVPPSEPAPPPVAHIPTLPQGALSAIAQLEATLPASLADTQSETISEPLTLTAAQNTGGGALGTAVIGGEVIGGEVAALNLNEGTVLDTRRTIGSMGASLRIVNGGVRLPQ